MLNRDNNKAMKLKPPSLPISNPTPKKNRNEKLRAKARRMFFEGISLSGLSEFYNAPSRPIRWMWISALLICGISISYHIVLLVIAYTSQNPTYEFLQLDEKVIPFPKITVCSPTGNNKTFSNENIRFPPREKQIFDRLDQKKQEEFMIALESLIYFDNNQYVAETSLRPHSPHYFAYHHIIIETYKQYPGSQNNFIKNGLLVPCQKMIFNCQFAGKSYDCCENIIMQSGEGGPCYDLRVDKMDELRDRPRSSGNPISFTFDLLTEWQHVLPHATINGFFIHIDDPYTLFGQPIAVQAGTHAMIDLSQPTLKIDKSGCIDKGNQTMFGPYDSRGYLCKQERYGHEIVNSFFNCGFSFGAYFPTDSCNGTFELPIKMILAYGESEKSEKKQQTIIYDIMNSKTRCLPLCKRWEYSPRASFSQLINIDYLTPIGNKQSANISRTRVTVYIGSSYYMQQKEQDAQPFYKTFLLIADVMALYVGISVVTLAEIFFYGCNLCLVYKKTNGNRNKVGPK